MNICTSKPPLSAPVVDASSREIAPRCAPTSVNLLKLARLARRAESGNRRRHRAPKTATGLTMPSGVSAPIRARTPALRHPGATKAHPISLQPPPRASQVIHFFKAGDDEASAHSALSASLSAASVKLESVKQEYCFNVQLADGQKPLSADEESRLD